MRYGEMNDKSAAPSVKELSAAFQNKLNENDDESKFKVPKSPVRTIRRPPPPPLHRKPPLSPPSSSTNDDHSYFERSHSAASFGRRSQGPKPKIAPKPVFLNGLIPSHSASAICSNNSKVGPSESVHHYPPRILVSPSADTKPPIIDFGDVENKNSVRARAEALESLGVIRRSNLPPRIDRPISEISTISQVSDDFDDGDTTASEEEADETGSDRVRRLERNKHDEYFDELPLPRQERKNTICTSAHTAIMNEMEAVVSNMNLKKKNGLPKLLARRQSSVEPNDIPADVGKLRNHRKGRHNSLFAPSSSSTLSHTSGDEISRFASITSDRSSIVTTGSGEDASDTMVPDYNTGDEEEDKRLKKLHYAALEFQKVQQNYVQYLREMAILYPEYMERFGKRIGKDLLAPQNGYENVVVQIKKVLSQILPSHEMMLLEINNVMANWNSETPNLSKTIWTFSDFLKCCTPFLDKKADFLNQMIAIRNENKEFDEATYMFETEVFKRGKKGAVLQQLDQVHQNFMRYKLLMLRYSEYLAEGSEEKKKAVETIEKLEKVTQNMNKKMGLPTTEELTKLYYRFQCQFNVLEPGRTLIRQGDVMKQTRREEQPRFLVLFTDVLYICRVNSKGHFDMNKSYRIPLESCRVETVDHDDYIRSLVIKSKVKSAILIFSSEKERDQWYDDIVKTIHDRRSYRRRQSEAICKVEENRKRMLKKPKSRAGGDGQIDEQEENEDEESETIERPMSLVSGLEENNEMEEQRSSQEFEADGFSSMPDTPLDDRDEPTFQDDEASTSRAASVQKKQGSTDVKPVWLPDGLSGECLMEGCNTEFGTFTRRHHCRDCGWLICGDCVGRAPLSKYNFEKQAVCPECFAKINKLYLDGTLFPTFRLVTISDGSFMVRIGDKNSNEIIEPRRLFKPPVNFLLKKRNIEEKRELALVFTKVYVKNKKAEIMRHAMLRKEDLKLIFYKAELDSKSVYEVLLYGYSFRETELDDKKGWLFELVHRNQIRTNDTKDDCIVFRVDNGISAKRWSKAFQDNLTMDPTQECSPLS